MYVVLIVILILQPPSLFTLLSGRDRHSPVLLPFSFLSQVELADVYVSFRCDDCCVFLPLPELMSFYYEKCDDCKRHLIRLYELRGRLVSLGEDLVFLFFLRRNKKGKCNGADEKNFIVSFFCEPSLFFFMRLVFPKLMKVTLRKNTHS